MNVRSVSLTGSVPGMLRDQAELTFLSGLQDQRNITARISAQQAAGVQALRDRGLQMPATATSPTSANGTQPIAGTEGDPLSASIDDGAGGIVNRSPTTTTNYHYYQQPTPTPEPAVTPTRAGNAPWWLVVPLVLATAGLTYLLWPKPAPPTPVVAPTKPDAPPVWTADPSILLKEWP